MSKLCSEDYLSSVFIKIWQYFPVTVIPDLVNKKNGNNTNGDMKVGLLNIILHPPCTLFTGKVYETGSTISSTSSGYGSYRTDLQGEA